MLCPLERRRNRSEEVVFAVSGSWAGWLVLLLDPPSTDERGSTGWESAVVGLLSGLGLPVPLEPFFLKTSLNRPTGDADLPVFDEGGAREDLLDFDVRDGPRSRVSDGSAALVSRSGTCGSAGCMSWRCSAWTTDDDVVK